MVRPLRPYPPPPIGVGPLAGELFFAASLKYNGQRLLPGGTYLTANLYCISLSEHETCVMERLVYFACFMNSLFSF